MKDLKIEKVNVAKKTDPWVSCSRDIDKQCQNLNTIVFIYGAKGGGYSSSNVHFYVFLVF